MNPRYCEGSFISADTSSKILDQLTHKKLTKLEVLDLAGLGISKVEDYTFYDMDNLRQLRQGDYGISSHMNITRIPQNAFTFRHSSNVVLELDISGLKIDSSNFDKNIFKSANRPMNITAFNTLLRVLDEEVFIHFFEKFPTNNIVFGRSLLSCEDCKNAWLIKHDYIKRTSQSFDYQCSRTLSRDPKYYDKCH
jgi:hypothetical protein